MKYVWLMRLLALFFVSSPAFAWDVLGIQPAVPTENQLISVAMGTGGCDAIPSIAGFPQVSQTGQNIRILFFGVRETDSEFCNFPPGQYAYPAGHYPAGNYVLTVDMLYEHFPFGPEIVTLATIPFSVSGSPVATPVAAPTLNGTGAVLLSALVIAIAAMTSMNHARPRQHASRLGRNRYGGNAELWIATAECSWTVKSHRSKGWDIPASVLEELLRRRRSATPIPRVTATMTAFPMPWNICNPLMAASAIQCAVLRSTDATCA
jgi:hypothetical protein